MMRLVFLILICIGLTAHTADEKAVHKGGSGQPVQMSLPAAIPFRLFRQPPLTSIKNKILNSSSRAGQFSSSR